MSSYNKEAIKDYFSLAKTGNKGWLLAQNECPFCGRTKHLALIFSEKVASFICQGCKEKGGLFKLLAKVKKLEYVTKNETVYIDKKLESKILISEEENDLDYNLPAIKPPLGFKQIFNNSYLDKRGFTLDHYKNYIIGISKIAPYFSNKIIFLVLDKDNNIVGYLGRDIRDKDKIDLYNRSIKENNKKIKNNQIQGKFKSKILRWQNSSHDFSKMIFGCNEIIPGITKTIIIVEGVTSKANIDKLLELFFQKEVKCNATFSNKVSSFQIKIWQDLGIENIIVLYDPDTLNINKKAVLELNRFFNVSCGFIENEDKDPGDLNYEELDSVLSSLYNPLNFYMSKVQNEINL